MNHAFTTQIENLGRDPLSAARAASKLGRRVIGYVGDVPLELIFAADAVPVRLQGNLTAPTPKADAYLETAFVPEVRAILEQWLNGELDFIETVIFSRSNDSAQRLYYYLCELQRTKRCGGPVPVLFDVATISRSTSFAHTLESVHHLAAALRCDLSALHVAGQSIRERANSLQLLVAARVAKSAVSGSNAYRMNQAAEYIWSASFDDELRQWLSSAPRRRYERRLILVGNAPPDERLHRAVEQGGATIVSELIERSPHITNDGASLEAIARRHHAQRTPAQRMLENQNLIVELVRNIEADGVIFWAIEEDEVLPWEVARQAASLSAANIPLLSLTRQRWLPDETVLNRVDHFARTLEAR